MKRALFLLMMMVGDKGVNTMDYLVHQNRGDAWYHAFDNQRALAEYTEAYRLAPDSFSTIERMVLIHNDMGRILLHKDSSSAIFYRRSLDFSDSLLIHFPGKAETHFWIALNEGSLMPFSGVHEKIERAKKVLEETNRALELDTSFAPAYVILGAFQREASRIGWFERIIARVVFGAEVSGSLRTSEHYLRMALRCDSTNPYAYYELFWTYRALHEIPSARQTLDKLLSIPPTSAREREQLQEADSASAELSKER